MSGQRTLRNHLDARKQLLITEAELQREHLRHDLDIIDLGVRNIGSRVQARLHSLAAAGALAAAGFSAFRHARRQRNNARASFVSKAWTAVRIGLSLWKMIRRQHQ